MQPVGAWSLALHHASGYHNLSDIRESYVIRRSIHHHHLIDNDVVQIHQVDSEIPNCFGALLHSARQISVSPVSLVAVQRKVAKRDVPTTWRGWRSRIGRHSRIAWSVVDAVVIGARLHEETRTTAQSRDVPIASGRKKQARNQCASVDDQRDRIFRGCAGPRGIYTRTVVSVMPAGVLVAPCFQFTIKRTPDLRSANVSHPRDRCRRRSWA